ncbi:hypothetical protein SARC_11386 [Sphaeroforma arctica JP610]|uniref:Alginate lyase domain-containing protein n=1 Tax=Sphaeroforma arctica JP610 TaxID=667725 RepID=A0A0L0FH90_9EUKA|nr:hypothetical protein SARC_11386 [Sphaeroforma arctica JP610]KNC76105.1 hypothetical protein SARC_11386 [Sphaeroforma arctica JP610]|eukprot:XP_014150007.1 hypothetical protein SARC_11386 [Sphaeroforma arctica JP610]
MFRNIGNDLPPRHEVGQTYRNVKFVLENEKQFDDLETRWLLNRLVNKTEEARVISLLKAHNQKWISSPFELDEYSKMEFRFQDFRDNPDIIRSNEFRKWKSKKQGELMDHIYHDKNRYIMHNNEARNLMIAEGKLVGAKWILPWDGNCFLTSSAWKNITTSVRSHSDSKYFWVPMERLLESNDVLFDPAFKPRLEDEPQLIFRYDAKEKFNGDMRYGRRSKVEMLWRLQVPGPWDSWGYHPWEEHFQTWKPSTDKPPGVGQIPVAGWVARLFSGRPKLETDLIGRGLDRVVAIRLLIDHCDADVAHNIYSFDEDSPLMWDMDVLEKEKIEARASDAEITVLINELVAICDTYLSAGDESEESELSFANRAAQVTALALTSFLTGEVRYAKHAAQLYVEWFSQTEAQQKVSDMKKFKLCAYLLDSLRMLKHSGTLSTEQYAGIRTWHASFLEMVLLNNKMAAKNKALIGKGMADENDFPAEYWSKGPQPVLYDAQVAAISAFTGDTIQFLHTVERAKMKMTARIRDQGDIRPPKLKDPKASDVLELEAWLELSRLASRAGVDLYGYQGYDAPSTKLPLILAAVNTALKAVNKDYIGYASHWHFTARTRYPINDLVCTNTLCPEIMSTYPEATPPVFPVWRFGLNT